jgi:predicted TIM-barrel fold metal-dependent hydrolase|tara:strand:- start:7789 stop:8814 length:1026 start_codon:yes stop_codon:yes gene_type:complete
LYITETGEKVFIMDGHTHLWDARKENRKNRFGATFIECFWNSHTGMSPQENIWPLQRFEHYGAENAAKDLFDSGYVDVAVMQPTYLYDFYKAGFNTIEQCSALKKLRPNNVVLNGRIDPRNGQKGLDQLHTDFEKWKFKGVKMYTAEWNGNSKGYKLTDDFVAPYLDRLVELNIKNVHLHKGPTIHPLSLDAFDVNDVDDIATSYPELNFIVDHCGLPRLEDFCWIALQEPNVYGGLAIISAFVHTRPKYFQKLMVDLMFYLGPDRLLFGSDYAIWEPRWIIEKLMAFEFDEEAAEEAQTQLTLEIKRKIMGENMAKLYDITPDDYLLDKTDGVSNDIAAE